MSNSNRKLAVTGLSKVFERMGRNKFSAVNDLNFSVFDTEFFTILGPSGCGKSTLLRMIAGLETPNSGTIVVNNETVYSSQERVNLSASRRNMGMVFQSFAIWPHMTVLQNVMFPLEVLKKEKGWSARDIEEKAHGMLKVVELDTLFAQNAAALSGGQKQRLSLARAIVAEPQLILLDEPLSNLDAKLRERLRVDLKSLQERLGLTLIYVTHDQDEALSLSDRIAVMNGGKILQIGTPEEIYLRPRSEFVAKFVGNGTFINDLSDPQKESGANMFVRPENIKLALSPSGPNWVETTVHSVEYFGDRRDVIVLLDDCEIKIRMGANLNIDAGAKAYLMIDPAKTISLPKP